MSTKWLKSIQLDEQFMLAMDANLRSQEHEPKLLDDLNEKYHLEIKNKPTHWLAGHLLLFFGRFCRINLSCCPKAALKFGVKRTTETTTGSGQSAQSHWLASLTGWPSLVTLMYFVSSVQISLGLYHHYVHDQFVLHLRRFRQAHEMRQMILVADYANSNITEEKLRWHLNHTYTQVKLFGAPYMEATYATECCYLFLLISCYSAYLNPMIYAHFMKRLDFYVVRLMLNRTFERRNFNRLIGEQVNNYIQSCCNFTEAFITRCIELNGLKTFKLEQLNGRSELKRLLLDYKNTIRTLKQMSLEGSLQPLNRSNKWIDKLTNRYCCVCVFLLMVPLSFYAYGFLILPGEHGLKLQTDPMDLVAVGALTLLSLLMAVSAVFYISLTIINGLDQVSLIEHLMGEIKDTIEDNKSAFKELADILEALDMKGVFYIKQEQQQQQPVEVADERVQSLLVSQMNDNLLFVVIHYKIFVAQMKPIQRSFGFICMTAMCTIFLAPLLGRLHLPYMTTGVRLFIVVMSLVGLALGNVCIAPVCHVHLKCLKLYKTLSDLLAHAVDVTSNSEQIGTRVYDKHTVWMLRKELTHPDRLAQQFATKSLGLCFGYPNLMRINFWFGILILSIVTTDIHSGEQEEVVGSLTSDPLGIFSLRLN